MKRALAALAIATLAACGGGGGSSTQSALPVAQTNSTAKANASATLNLRFPAHTARVKLVATTSSKTRKPAYINPNGSQLVITAFGNTLTDPSSGYPYFTLGTQDPTTGVSTLSIPLFSGSYNQGDLTITEYDCCGDVLAYGYNAPYTDANGSYQPGNFSLVPGGTAAPVITMVMNAVGIALTPDPVAGTNSFALSPNYPGNNVCPSSVPITYYAFPIDASGTFVLPGQTPGAGLTGGDSNSFFPGVGAATLSSQSPNGGNASFSTTVLGPSVVTLNDPDGFSTTTATFVTQNPLSQITNPYSPQSEIYDYVTIGPGNC